MRKALLLALVLALVVVGSALVESFDGLAANAAGFQSWLEIDKDVLGGNYRGHYPGSPEQTAINEQGNRYPEGEATGRAQSQQVNPNLWHGLVNTKALAWFISPSADYRTGRIPPSNDW